MSIAKTETRHFKVADRFKLEMYDVHELIVLNFWRQNGEDLQPFAIPRNLAGQLLQDLTTALVKMDQSIAELKKSGPS